MTGWIGFDIQEEEMNRTRRRFFKVLALLSVPGVLSGIVRGATHTEIAAEDDRLVVVNGWVLKASDLRNT